MKIVLASGSPRRRELMKYLAEEFETLPLDADETIPAGVPPLKASEYLAAVKARAAAELRPNDIVIGCDTTVICDDIILGKPADKTDCVRIISALSGRAHTVVTGCAIACAGKIVSFSEETEVVFRKLSAQEIEAYASTDEHYDKAGGYGIQGKGSALVESIRGDFFNVVGLPVGRLFNELKKFI